MKRRHTPYRVPCESVNMRQRVVRAENKCGIRTGKEDGGVAGDVGEGDHWVEGRGCCGASGRDYGIGEFCEGKDAGRG